MAVSTRMIGIRFSDRRHSPRMAFTLVEMLVVLSIIGILIALIFPLVSAAKTRAMFTSARAELEQIQTAIEDYHAKYQFYPPDNPNNSAINQLYFELEGTVLVNGVYQTLDGSGQIAVTDLSAVFSPTVTGLRNSSTDRKSEEGSQAVNFLKASLRPNQIGQLKTPSGFVNAPLLLCSAKWPDVASQPVPVPPALANGFNPWRYVSTAPTNNPKGFDLWIDILVRGKTNRICNWRREPQIL